MATKRTMLRGNETLLRHIPKNRLRVDGESGRVIGILPQALELRPSEEYLSTWYVEHFGVSQPANVYYTIIGARRKRNIAKKDCYALAHVSMLIATCIRHGFTVRVSHEPNSNDKAYATVREFNNNSAMLEELAETIWCDLIVDASVPKATSTPASNGEENGDEAKVVELTFKNPTTLH